MNIRKALILPIILCISLAGCSKDDGSATATMTQAVQTPPPTPTGSIVSFTPVPEPSILVNQSRGETVARIQRRLKDLGYLHYRPTGYFLDMTQQALKFFQQENDLTADGSAGKDTLDELFNNPYPNRRNTSGIPGQQAPEANETTATGNVLMWQSVSQLIPQGTQFDVQDCNTNITLKLVRTGGSNHMHAQPASAADSEALATMFSKVVTGEKRPVLVRFEGQVIASSLYGAPHGTSYTGRTAGNESSAEDGEESSAEENTSVNAFEGEVCIYFTGSTDEKYSMPDWEHNNNINKAAGNEN